MIIKKIDIHNFRNYKEAKINFHKNVNIFYGKNGMGKTTIIEAINYLSNLKSHRTNYNINLIKKNETKFFLEGTFYRDKIMNKVSTEVDFEKKTIFLDNKQNKNKEITSLISTIIFEPGDLELIKGSPNERRRYINDQLSQLSSNYYKANLDFEKTLKNRNNLLKQFQTRESTNQELLDVLTNTLIEKSFKIFNMRNQYIENLNRNIETIFFDITGIPNFQIEYKSFFTNLEKQQVLEEYRKVEKEEKEKGMTLIGIHRDDLIFKIKNDDLKVFGSQGQQRMGVISLKLAEIPIFYKIKETYPIVLLDDIFSELDIEKRNKLLKYINNDIQTIITTTDLESIDEKLIEMSKIFNVEEGLIIEEVDNE